jgi:hypothetical protein
MIVRVMMERKYRRRCKTSLRIGLTEMFMSMLTGDYSSDASTHAGTSSIPASAHNRAKHREEEKSPAISVCCTQRGGANISYSSQIFSRAP